MKKIEELYQEILQNEGLKAEFVEAAKDNQMEAFLQKNDCNATPSELQEFAEKKQSELGFLPDAELDAASGGANGIDSYISALTFSVWCRQAVNSTLQRRGGSTESSDRLLCRL